MFYYPFRELSGIFIKFKIVVCRLFQFGPVQNLSSGNGLMFEFGLLVCCLARVNHEASLIHFIFYVKSLFFFFLRKYKSCTEFFLIHVAKLVFTDHFYRSIFYTNLNFLNSLP